MVIRMDVEFNEQRRARSAWDKAFLEMAPAFEARRARPPGVADGARGRGQPLVMARQQADATASSSASEGWERPAASPTAGPRPRS